MDQIKKIYLKYKEIINYLIVGGLTTVVSLAVYYLLVIIFLNPDDAFQLQIANIISWIAGVTFAYFTNRKFVFESKENNKLKEASKFVLARVITLVMDMLIMFLGVTVLHGNDKIMKLVSQIVITISNYVFSKIFVFKK
jgi:putative flippase GtrA